MNVYGDVVTNRVTDWDRRMPCRAYRVRGYWVSLTDPVPVREIARYRNFIRLYLTVP